VPRAKHLFRLVGLLFIFVFASENRIELFRRFRIFANVCIILNFAAIGLKATKFQGSRILTPYSKRKRFRSNKDFFCLQKIIRKPNAFIGRIKTPFSG
jgi:uncharacterized membrane protein YbhN (UPF0104 family)